MLLFEPDDFVIVHTRLGDALPTSDSKTLAAVAILAFHEALDRQLAHARLSGNTRQGLARTPYPKTKALAQASQLQAHVVFNFQFAVVILHYVQHALIRVGRDVRTLPVQVKQKAEVANFSFPAHTLNGQISRLQVQQPVMQLGPQVIPWGQRRDQGRFRLPGLVVGFDLFLFHVHSAVTPVQCLQP